MTTLLKSGLHKILSVFYRRKNAKIHLRELARETNLYGQSISRYLRELEKKKILRSEKEGNLKQFSLHANARVYALLTQFDVEKMQQLPLQRKNAITTYLKALPVPPIFAIVFGSTAKETYKDDSDIDILIVTNSILNASTAEKEADALTGIKISTFQITFNDFKRELKLKDDKVFQSAAETGYPVMNHIHYYEVIQHERV